MPTVDFISPAGAFSPAAVGDGQDLTTTFTIGSGSASLVCNGASPFVSGDTGKSFNLVGAGASGATLSGTLTFVSSTQVTLSVTAGTAFSSTSARLVWGTDNAPAARAFNTWAQAQTSPITLTMGTGAKKLFYNSGDNNQKRNNSLVWNVAQPITIIGNGPTTTVLLGGAGGGFDLGVGSNIKSGNGNYSNASIWTARLQTAQAGSSNLSCVTVGDAAQFSNNTWALITGIDLQGFGTPPNPFYYEYVLITNVNTSTGAITLSAPIANTYESTWPAYSAGVLGLQPDHGGPATLYAIDQAWAINATYQALGTDNSLTGGQTHCGGMTMALNNVKCLDAIGIIPSVNRSFTATGCDLSSYEMEFDKMVYLAIFDSTQVLPKFQSSNNQVTVRNGSTVKFNGTPRFLTVSNSTIMTEMIVGAAAYGRTDSISMSNVTFAGGTPYSIAAVDDSGDISGNFQADYSMANGVIKIPRAGLGAIRWGIPGTRCFFKSNFGGYCQSFKVTDVTADATYIYVSTDLSGGFPSYAKGIHVSPCESMTATSTTGIPQADNFTAMTLAGYGGKPVGTYAKFTFNGATMGYQSSGFESSMPDQVWGNVTSYTINVTTPYTGINSNLGFNAGVAVNGVSGSATTFLANGTTSAYLPQIDLKAAGKRTIAPSGVTGSTGTDFSLALPGAPSSTWLTEQFDTQNFASHNVVAEYNGKPSIGPVFTMELISTHDTNGASPPPPSSPTGSTGPGPSPSAQATPPFYHKPPHTHPLSNKPGQIPVYSVD
jgi:hypothetical protein